MANDFIFAYGSNMNYSDLRSWLERNGYDSSLIVMMTPAILDGYDYVWNYYSSGRQGGAANIEPKEDTSVWGVLIEIDVALLKAFDRKETHPIFYSRGNERVPVRVQPRDETIPAWVYIANPNKGNRRDVLPSREYKRIVLEAVIEMNFPEDQIEMIEAWGTG
ncbi:gamma-glutamylcyclotransferase family protein [Thermodesulfobacteriota bacterium]